MRLESLEFREYPGQESEWALENLSLGTSNLLVGKNATGKTRTLNVIDSLSRLLTGREKNVFFCGEYHAVFRDGANQWNYDLVFADFNVTVESLHYNGESVLSRGEDRHGKILAEDVEGKPVRIKFNVPAGQIAAFAKRDDAQHSFLTPLHHWAESVRHFKFGSKFDPASLAFTAKEAVSASVNEKDTSQLVPIFDKAQKKFGNAYTEAVIADMREIGYDLDHIEIRKPRHVRANGLHLGEPIGVSVKEKDLRGFIDQPEMSSGMFRAFSLLAQLNYYFLADKGGCFLIDDIGEGLDFERASSLVKLCRRKTHESASAVQLIMTTNDRFVMNAVPLEEWTVLQRVGHSVRVRNYANSKEIFDEFKFTGLSNFDFFATEFLESEEGEPEGVEEAVVCD